MAEQVSFTKFKTGQLVNIKARTYVGKFCDSKKSQMDVK